MVYKDQERNTWYCKFYYVDWTGQKRQKMKRGFKLQREAKEWEKMFLEQYAKNPDVSFETLYQKYKEYITPRVRESTASSRFSMIDKHIMPFFQNRIVSDIGPSDIVAWQNNMLNKGLSSTYLNQANVYLKAMFNYAVDYMGLQKNPCKKNIGSRKTKKLNFWTPEEYKMFIEQCKDNIGYYTMFEILYYTGMREGELLALTIGDIDFQNKLIHINKTRYRIPGKELINEPKTESSKRSIDIPDFLVDEIKDYINHMYKPLPETRLFDKSYNYINFALKTRTEMAGVKQIRVHDLRHSHASTLINLGANPVLVAERLGHESADITLRIYSHLFPRQQTEIVSKIQKV